MGYLEVSNLSFGFPGGRMLFENVSFRVGEGQKAALIGANGVGKTTLLKILAGELPAAGGGVHRQGDVRMMPQFIGSIRDDSSIVDMLADLDRAPIRSAYRTLRAAESRIAADERSQMAYAEALSAWGDVGGYEAEVGWEVSVTKALGLSLDEARERPVRTLSGGEQKKLALSSLLLGSADVLLLDEPDNYLDIPAKYWMEEQLAESRKTVLFISHDREVLARAATHVVTLEGTGAWVHGGGFRDYPEARARRMARLDELHRRWDEEHQRLKDLVRTLQQQAAVSSAMAARYRATVTRLERYERSERPQQRPAEQNVRMSLKGGRTGKRVVVFEQLALTGLTKPFDLEVFFGERVAVLGSNGTGKSHLLRLLAAGGTDGHLHDPERHGKPVAHTGQLRLGARVVPGWFAQTHERPDLTGRTLVDILWTGDTDRPSLPRGAAVSALRRYEIHDQADNPFDTLSGGQQARFQILLLELAGATLLLLDEPTDNLDLHSAEALQTGLEAFDGTVLAVTHDRWFARCFDRFLTLSDDGSVSESFEPGI
ncbi:ABC-F family ATP-binding cassette domain-containing protein [Micromonospora sp. NPDC004336]